MHPSENAVKEQNEDLHHKPRNNPGDHCAASGVLSAGRSFLQTDVGIDRLTDRRDSACALTSTCGFR